MLAVVSGISAWLATAEAVEERRSATAAVDFRLAVLTLASSPSVTESDVGYDSVVEAVDVVAGNIDEVARSLNDADRRQVVEDIDEIGVHGASLLSGTTSIPDHSLHDHESTEALLRQASVDSNVAAADQERLAKWSMASVALFVVLFGYALVALRWAARRAALARDSEFHAAARLAAVLDETPDLKIIIADDGRISYYSSGMARTFAALGFAANGNWSDLVQLSDPEIREQLDAYVLTADADAAPVTFSMAQLLDDPALDGWLQIWVSDLTDDPLVDGRLVTARDVTAEVCLQKELEQRALHDALTGLPNRWSLINTMGDQPKPVTLLMIDLDGFKQTNDVLGHRAGDQVLQEVARRFTTALAESTSKLFRLGGDEFAVVIEATDLQAAEQTARQLLCKLADPVRLNQTFERVRASIGIAMGSPGENDPERVLRHADIALYAAKAAGGNQFKVFEAAMEATATERRELSHALEAADIDSDFRLVFQPLVDAQSGRITHLEALLRWNSPILGFVPPDVFIPAAESSGKILPIGQFVLDQACRQLADLRSEGLAAEMGMSVNISPRQLDQPGFVDQVLALLSHHALLPDDLTIEVTETVLFSEFDLGVAQLYELKAAGCRIAVDDFGSGYSNLGRLLQLPLDMIKVDRSLVVMLVERLAMQEGPVEGQCQVMSAICSIGDAIGAMVVAEGIETREQWHSMRDCGVPLLQGYLFSRPLEAADIAAIVRTGIPVADQHVLTS